MAFILGSAFAANDIVTGQFLEAHRSAGMKFIRADADLGAKSEFSAIGESSRGVPIDGRRVDATEEPFAVLSPVTIASL